MNNPRYYGFNFLWMFTTHNRHNLKPRDIHIAEDELDFIAEMGCNFVRLPLDYRFWIRDFKYEEKDEAMLSMVDGCIDSVISRGFHCSLNIHRAPGYCINGAELEKHNLWQDEEAQTAFIQLWKDFALRYASIPAEKLSFDLLNEPPNIGQYGVTREIHEDLMRRTAAAIRSVTPDRPITLDGLGGGNLALPELADLGVTMSTRGYQPMALTHYRAAWCDDTKGLSKPVYPGTEYQGKCWDKKALLDFYKPWVDLSASGVPVHVGEFGCYNKVNNKLALAWFEDILSIYNELGWGYSLWNFSGEFGIINHKRSGTRWERRGKFHVDRDLYELYRAHMKK